MKDIHEPNKASKRTLTSLFKQIELIKTPEKVEKLKANIKSTIAATASVLMEMILHNNSGKDQYLTG